jgi:hypothetical protein
MTNNLKPDREFHIGATKPRKYWVVSQNLSPRTLASLNRWKQIIRRKHVAIMGWRPHHPIGRRFIRKIEPGDAILIARRHKGEPEMVGFGIVDGDAVRGKVRANGKWYLKGDEAPGHIGSFRRLSPFVLADRPPKWPRIIEALKHTTALAELHPDSRPTHRLVCEWMDRLLARRGGTGSAGGKSRLTGASENPAEDVELAGLQKNNDHGYKYRSKRQIVKAQKKEADLVKRYRDWIWKKYGRDLNRFKIGAGWLVCDCFDREPRNLVEAKASISREDIRMAVGQLLDYKFYAERKFGKLHKAILLPEQPRANTLGWLRPLKISLIWRTKSTFKDNTKRHQFT